MGVRDRRNDLPSPAAVRESGVSLQGTSLTPFVRTLDPSPDWPGVRNFFATLSAQPAYHNHAVEELRLIDYGRTGSARSAYGRTPDYTSNPPLAFAAICAMPAYNDVCHEEIRLDDYWYHGSVEPHFEYDFDVEPDSNLSAIVPVLSLNSFDVPTSSKLRRAATTKPSFSSWSAPVADNLKPVTDKAPLPPPPLPPVPVEPASPPEPISPHVAEDIPEDENSKLAMHGAPPRAATFATSRDQPKDVDKADLLEQLQAMYTHAEEITASSDKTNSEEKLKSLRERAQMFNRALGLIEEDEKPEDTGERGIDDTTDKQESDALSATNSPHADAPELPEIDEESDDVDATKISLAQQRIFPSALALPESPSSEVHEVSTEFPDELNLSSTAPQSNNLDDIHESEISKARYPFQVSTQGKPSEELQAAKGSGSETSPRNDVQDLPQHSFSSEQKVPQNIEESSSKSRSLETPIFESNPFAAAPTSIEVNSVVLESYDAKPNPFDEHTKKHSMDRPRTGQDSAFNIGRSKSKTGLAKSKSRSALGRSGSLGGIRSGSSGLIRTGPRGGLGRSSSSSSSGAPGGKPSKKSKRRHSQLNAAGNAFGPNPTPFVNDVTKSNEQHASFESAKQFSQQLPSESETAISEMSDISVRPSSSVVQVTEDVSAVLKEHENISQARSFTPDAEMDPSSYQKSAVENIERPKSMFAAALSKFEAVEPAASISDAALSKSRFLKSTATVSSSPKREDTNLGSGITVSANSHKGDDSALIQASNDPFDTVSSMEEAKSEQIPSFKQTLRNLENNVSLNPVEPKSLSEKSASPVLRFRNADSNGSNSHILDMQKKETPVLDEMMTTRTSPLTQPTAVKEDLSLPLMAPSTSVTTHIAETLNVSSSSPAPSSGNSVLSGSFETSLIKTNSSSNEPGSTASEGNSTFLSGMDKESSVIMQQPNTEAADCDMIPAGILSKSEKKSLSEEDNDEFDMKQSSRRVSFRVVESAGTSDRSLAAHSDKSETSESGGLDPTRKPAPLPPYAVRTGKNGNGEGYDSDTSNSEEFVDAVEEGTVSSKASDRFWAKMRSTAKQRAEDAELEKLSRESLTKDYQDDVEKSEFEVSNRNDGQPSIDQMKKGQQGTISDSIAKRMQVFLASEKTGSVVDDGVGTSSMTDSLVDESLRKSPTGHDAFRLLGGRFFSKKKKSSEGATEEKQDSKTVLSDSDPVPARSRKINATAQRSSKASSSFVKPAKQIKKSPSGSDSKRARHSIEHSDSLKEEIRKSLSSQSDSNGPSSKPKLPCKAGSGSYLAEPTDVEVQISKKKSKDDSTDREVKELGRKRDQKKGLPESMMKRMEAVTSLSDNPTSSASSEESLRSGQRVSAAILPEENSVKRKAKNSILRPKKSVSQREMTQRSGKKRSSAAKHSPSSETSKPASRNKKKSSRHSKLEPRATSDILDPNRKQTSGDDLAPRASSSILGLSRSRSRKPSRASNKKNAAKLPADVAAPPKINAASMAVLPSAGDGRQISLARRHSMPQTTQSSGKLSLRGRNSLVDNDIDRARLTDIDSAIESGEPRAKRNQTMLSALWASGSNNDREGSFGMPKMRRASTDLGPQHVMRHASMHIPSTGSDMVDEPLRGGLLSGVKRLFSRKLRRKERERGSAGLDRNSIAGIPEDNGPRGSVSRGSAGLRSSITRGSSGMRGSITRGSTGARGSTQRGSTGGRVPLVGRASGTARRAKSEHKNARRRAPLFG